MATQFIIFAKNRQISNVCQKKQCRFFQTTLVTSFVPVTLGVSRSLFKYRGKKCSILGPRSRTPILWDIYHWSLVFIRIVRVDLRHLKNQFLISVAIVCYIFQSEKSIWSAGFLNSGLFSWDYADGYN